MPVSALNNTKPTSSSSAGTQLGATSTAADAGDRFLTMLVAQMKNQDPLNPMDNAQLTSQLAQISTVQGLETLNTTMGGMNAQFLQMQTLQSAALVGRDVAMQGDKLRIADGVGDGGFELQSAADKVKVEIVTPGGEVVQTLDMGPLEGGRHSFNVEVPDSQKDMGLTFRVTATSGTNTVPSMTLQYDTIRAVSAFGDTLTIEVSEGQRVAYNAVWAFL